MNLKYSLPIVVLLAAMAVTVMPAAAKPTSITVTTYETQFQWRAWEGSPSAWTYFQPSYQTSSDFNTTGDVLHTTIFYSPAVTNLQGGSTVYTYNKASGKWINHEGTVSYNYQPDYGPYTATNYFRGYLDFGGKTPSTSNFVHAVLYQWVYIFAPNDAATQTALTNLGLTYAKWDPTLGAWLVGFSIYIDDPAVQSYTITSNPIPTPIPEPVPANNYNPLGL